MRLVLISDDLTGALDSAVAFVVCGLKVVCAVDESALSAAAALRPDVLAVSLNSREISEMDMKTRLAALLGALHANAEWRDAVLFKKIDSRLKGHIEAEIKMLRPHRQNLLVCPAIPLLGRVVKDGQLQGAGVDVPIPVGQATGQRDEHCIDALIEDDLDLALRRVDPAQTLFVGAAGLAAALARRLVPVAPPPPAAAMAYPAVFAIGSRDPVTLAQVAAFKAIAAPNGRVPDTAPASLTVLQMTQEHPPVSPVQAGVAFAQGVAEFVRLHQTESLLACGGETAAAILRELDARLLVLEAEAMVGVPVSRLLDGMPGLRFVSKSGGFGGPDTLTRLVEMFGPVAEMH